MALEPDIDRRQALLALFLLIYLDAGRPRK